MERVRRSVTRALALVHAALDEMHDANLEAAKLHATHLLPELRRLLVGDDPPAELVTQIGELNAMLVLLRRRLAGRSRTLN